MAKFRDYRSMSREELENLVGTNDPAISREELVIMAMEMDKNADQP